MALLEKDNILAIVSPNQNAYSETFIQAHRNIPGVSVRFYYDGLCPRRLEGAGVLMSSSLNSRILRKVKGFLVKTDLTLHEEAFYLSLKKEKVNCVLAEYGPAGCAVEKVCRKLNVPLIVHFHGYDASVTELLEKYAERYRQLFSTAAKVIAVSKKMASVLRKAGCPEHKLVFNPYGPNDTYFNVGADYREKLLVGAGRFVDKKAPYYTILAFSKVLEKVPDARLVLGGDGPLLDVCRNIVNYYRLSDKVLFPGVLTPKQMQDYFTHARAFVQHSVTAKNGDMEGTPVAILEAGAAGLPVVSTRHAGIPDVVIEGETGLLVDEHDVDGMSLNMLRVLEDRDFASQLGTNAKKHIAANYTLARHLNLLGDLIKSSSKAS